MTANEIVNTLRKFKSVDKYEDFRKIQSNIVDTTEDRKKLVEDILNDCSKELLDLFEQSTIPKKTLLKQVIVKCMDKILQAHLDAPNRDFGYELCWYLAEKVQVNLKKSSESKAWGYWKVEANQVVTRDNPKTKSKI